MTISRCVTLANGEKKSSKLTEEKLELVKLAIIELRLQQSVVRWYIYIVAMWL